MHPNVALIEKACVRQGGNLTQDRSNILTYIPTRPFGLICQGLVTLLVYDEMKPTIICVKCLTTMFILDKRDSDKPRSSCCNLT